MSKNTHNTGGRPMKYGPVVRARVNAMRRRALKRWLRRRGIAYASRDMYSESALRKLVRDNADEVKEATHD